MAMHNVSFLPTETREVIGFSGIGVTYGHWLSCVFLDMDFGPLSEQQAILISEPSFQPFAVILRYISLMNEVTNFLLFIYSSFLCILK